MQCFIFGINAMSLDQLELFKRSSFTDKLKDLANNFEARDEFPKVDVGDFYYYVWKSRGKNQIKSQKFSSPNVVRKCMVANFAKQVDKADGNCIFP